MDRRLELVAFIETCGAVAFAAQRLRVPVAMLADMALGIQSVSIEVGKRLARLAAGGTPEDFPPRHGNADFAEYLRLHAVDLNGAAARLGVAPGYLLHQARLRYPTGAVMRRIREELARAREPGRESDTPESIREKLAELLAKRAPPPETIEARNARIREERAAAQKEREHAIEEAQARRSGHE